VYADAVIDLRRARRKRRLQKVNVAELLYRGYLTIIGVAAGVWALSNLPRDRRLSAHQVATAAAHGPAFVGIAVAAVVVLSVRGGARGGPLVLEAPDIQHILLAPLPRSEALRRPAVQRIRAIVLGLAGAGAIAGVLAAKRFPHPTLEWIATGAAAGAMAGALGVGVGLMASGRRLSPHWASAISVLVLGWSIADGVEHLQTSPFTLIGRVALYPIAGSPAVWLVALLPAATLGLGMAWVEGISLEAAMRRASLVGQLRFALTVRDLRTVVVLARLLAEERPRGRPLLRLRPGTSKLWGVWKRDWQGILRWPAARFLRVLVLAALAGAALRGVWNGTTPLLAVAGICLWLVAMDADVGLAGEIDRTDTARSLPLDEGELLLRHQPASVVAVGVLAFVGGVAGAQIGGLSVKALTIGAVVLVPAAIAAVAAAAVSTVRSVYGSGNGLLSFSPEAAGLTMVIREVLPPAIATAGVVPVWAAHHLAKHPSLQVSTAESWGFLPLVLASFVAFWLSYRGLK
jgi:hypothetical protein